MMSGPSPFSVSRADWSIPVNAAAAKLVKFGKLPVSLRAGVG